jgi:hypothetical protein
MRRLVPFVAACFVIGGAAWLFAQSDPPPTPTPSLVPVIADCAVSGTGALPGGEMFEGSASTVGSIYSVRWEHTAPGITFTTDTADSVNCFLNGGIIAVVDGFGTGTLNGVPGYIYTIFAEDRHTPGQPAVTLTASRTSPPTLFTDGEATFSPPRQVTIPATLEVVEGNPGNGWTRLYLGDVRCDYRGDGTVYAFERCPGSPGFGPGATFEVRSARLRVRTPGDDNDAEPSIVVRATIAPAVPGSGAPDIYAVTVFDGFGNILYDFGVNLMDGEGDIVVNFL